MAIASDRSRPPASLRVYLTAPSAGASREFLRQARASRSLHGRFAAPPASPQAFAAYLDRCGREDFFSCWVRSKEDDSLVGVYNLSQIFYGGFQSAYLGYYAFAPSAGRGLMSAGLRLLLAAIFSSRPEAATTASVPRLHRIEANIQPDNHASIGLVQACGFRQEGYSPRYLKIAGRWRDHLRFALLREDFQAQARSARQR